MMIQLDLLSEEAGLRREAAEGVQELRRNAARASELTRQLLMFSRRQVATKEILCLDDVVAEVVRMLGRTLGEHITLQVVTQPCQPAIEADRGMLAQLLLNLALNARDAMPQGGTLTLQTEARSPAERPGPGNIPEWPGRWVTLTVRDTGCGMNPETLTHLFEPFFTTKEVGKGTGLGLAMVYGIVQQHDARIEVESVVGQGSLFRVHFPAVDAPHPPVIETDLQPPRPQEPGHGTLLVVEDESSVRRMIRVALARAGYTVLEAANGTEALVLWKQHAPTIDLLFTDLVMPGCIGGLQLARALRADRPELKVIFTSGHSRDLAEGAEQLDPQDEYLPKPYRIDRLHAAVRQVLGQKNP
jgi:CheY-like chemotaxis protein